MAFGNIRNGVLGAFPRRHVTLQDREIVHIGTESIRHFLSLGGGKSCKTMSHKYLYIITKKVERDNAHLRAEIDRRTAYGRDRAI